MRVWILFSPAPGADIALTKKGFQRRQRSRITNNITVNRRGCPALRVNVFHTCPHINKLGEDLSSQNNIFLSSISLNKAL